MATSPSIALALIMKNEIKNLPRLFSSVNGCFDEIHITDTGSTDDSVKWVEENGEKVAGCPVFVHHFKWINSFSSARNYSFSHVKTDYICWMDLDDTLKNPDNFKSWKKNAMALADMYFVSYNYALNPDDTPIISFMRERVFKTSLNPQWQYDLHEGVVMKSEWKRDVVVAAAWAIDHRRDAEDMKADKSRNITILDEIKRTKGLDARLSFYYGKELYEAQRPHEAIVAFDDVLQKKDLEHHDKILAYQYAGYASLALADMIKDEAKEEKNKWIDKAIQYAIGGLAVEPSRAEFYVLAGDSYLRRSDMLHALPLYAAAKHCFNPSDYNIPSPVYHFKGCYGENPSLQIAKIYFNSGRMDEAEKEAKECFEKYKNKEAKDMLDKINEIRPLITLDNNQKETEDIVFSCPPQTAYEFNEVLYETKGMGGSETALIEMARELKKKTGRPVKVFTMREDVNDLVAPSGVEYISTRKLNSWMSQNKPFFHIAWRHNIKITNAPTYLWCHDLLTPQVEARHNFDKIMCLTDFHKGYVKAKQGVPDDKIWVTRNGIVPSKFDFERPKKNPNKVVWMSSPDRGLDRAMKVLDIVRKSAKDIELHVYYGLENLYKYGLSERADMLKKMMEERPWVKYHGFTEQSKMYKEVADAVIWLHPCDFIETFCITALEMLELGIYPVTRSLGGLQNTLEQAVKNDQAIMLPHDCVSEEEYQAYAKAFCEAWDSEAWKKVYLEAKKHSWSSVADEWIKEMNLREVGPDSKETDESSESFNYYEEEVVCV